MPVVDTDDVQETFKTVEKTIAGFTWLNLVTMVFLLVACVAGIRIILSLFDRAANRAKMDQGVRHFLHSGLKVILWLVAICVLLGYLGVPMTSMVAVLSVLGLAISLAVQGILSNLAGGIMLLTSRPFRAGDFVEAGGSLGTVESIGLVYTRLKTVDNRVVQIPNGDISGKTITNFSAEPFRRVDLTFTASYDADVSLVEKTIRAVLEDHPLTLDQPEPYFAKVSGYGSSAIEYTVRVWCAGKDYWTVYFDVIKQVKGAFDANGIEMTYDHLNVHMVKD